MQTAPIDDVYVFARDTDPGLVGRFMQNPVAGVRFLANTSGAFSAFAVVEAPDLAQLPALVASVFGPAVGGGGDPETAKPIAIGTEQLRRTKPFARIAFARIWAEPGRAADVLDATATLTGYNGSAIVAGEFDVLVEVGADSDAALFAQLLGELHKLPGVRRTATALVVGEYFYRPAS
jgi:hypothetical protein